MLAFHNNPEIKARYVARMKLHRSMDELRRGVYWNGYRGCAVGCTIEQQSDVHKRFEEELGIPESLVYLEDVLFESMTWERALDFPIFFLEIIKEGADLSDVFDKFVLRVLMDNTYGLYWIASESTRGIIGHLVSIINRKLKGEVVSIETWENMVGLCSLGVSAIDIGRCDRGHIYSERAIFKFISYYTYNEPDIMTAVTYSATAYSYDSESFYPYKMERWMDYMAGKLLKFLEDAPVVNMLTEVRNVER